MSEASNVLLWNVPNTFSQERVLIYNFTPSSVVQQGAGNRAVRDHGNTCIQTNSTRTTDY